MEPLLARPQLRRRQVARVLELRVSIMPLRGRPTRGVDGVEGPVRPAKLLRRRQLRGALGPPSRLPCPMWAARVEPPECLSHPWLLKTMAEQHKRGAQMRLQSHQPIPGRATLVADQGTETTTLNLVTTDSLHCSTGSTRAGNF